jgi:hypothetical protein
MSNQLKETIGDYGIENSLDAMIDLIEFRCLSELHKAAILAYLGFAEKVFPGGRVWGFTHFQVVNYLIFREKVPEFSPQSLQRSALFEVKKV